MHNKRSYKLEEDSELVEARVSYSEPGVLRRVLFDFGSYKKLVAEWILRL